jgi:hypothetical protein
MADPAVGGGVELPPPEAFPPLGELPMSNVTGFCTINERGIGWVAF